MIRLLPLLAALAGCIPVPVPVPLPPASRPPPTAEPAPAAALEAEIHQRVNRYRASRGLAPLRHDERVAELARRHSAAMAAGRVSFGHDGFAQRAAAVQALFPVAALSENVAYNSGPDPAARIAEQWLASPGHRDNIVGPSDVTGIGVARTAAGVYYATQLFAQQR